MSPLEWPIVLWLTKPAVIIGISASSIVMVIVSLIGLRFYVAKMPIDYFVVDRPQSFSGLLSRLLWIFKNIAGFIFLCLGIAMLVLPGQGILTMLVGVTLLDFPGKGRLQRRLVSLPGVLKALNHLRARSGQPPLLGVRQSINA